MAHSENVFGHALFPCAFCTYIWRWWWWLSCSERDVDVKAITDNVCTFFLFGHPRSLDILKSNTGMRSKHTGLRLCKLCHLMWLYAFYSIIYTYKYTTLCFAVRCYGTLMPSTGGPIQFPFNTCCWQIPCNSWFFFLCCCTGRVVQLAQRSVLNVHLSFASILDTEFFFSCCLVLSSFICLVSSATSAPVKCGSKNQQQQKNTFLCQRQKGSGNHWLAAGYSPAIWRGHHVGNGQKGNWQLLDKYACLERHTTWYIQYTVIYSVVCGEKYRQNSLNRITRG